MKNFITRRLKRWIGLFALLALCSSIVVQAQTKRALIVAIGNYPAETEWRNINSKNDIPLIKSALTKQGFTEFVVLLDSEATKAKIIAGMKALESRCEAGDIVAIHFSSHGQCITDNNGDELDGYDEAIVAYGAPMHIQPNYKGEEHLRDDDIDVLTISIRRKLGPKGDLLVIVDACHSGTITRSEEVIRGGMEPMGLPAETKSNEKPSIAEVGFYQDQEETRGNSDDLAPYVLISASLAHQANSEYKGAGSLSTAISRSVDKLGPDMSYRSYFAQILKEMSHLAPNQKPAIEGNIDRTVFGGTVVDQQPFYTAYEIVGDNIFLSAGTLNGLFKGSKVGVYAAGTRDFNEAVQVAEGEIVVAEATWSKLILNKDVGSLLTDYWYFVTEQNLGLLKINVKQDISEKTARKETTNILENFAVVKLTDESVDVVVVSNKAHAGFVDLLNASDYSEIKRNISLENNGEILKEAITWYAKGRYYKNLELNNPSLKLSFEFKPYRIDAFGEVIDTLSLEDLTENGIVRVDSTIKVELVITNHGRLPAYFAIIDIQPNGKINGIVPSPDPNDYQNASDFKIEPGQTYSDPDASVYFGAPYGLEVFKLFASKEPINFSPIITPKGVLRGDMTSLEALFGNMNETATRGGVVKFNKSLNASTFSFTFEIRE